MPPRLLGRPAERASDVLQAKLLRAEGLVPVGIFRAGLASPARLASPGGLVSPGGLASPEGLIVAALVAMPGGSAIVPAPIVVQVFAVTGIGLVAPGTEGSARVLFFGSSE